MNKILESWKKERETGIKEQPILKTKPAAPKKSRYNYEEIERKTFLNVTRKGGETNGL